MSRNAAYVGDAGRQSAVQFLELELNEFSSGPEGDRSLIQYLTEIGQLSDAPGEVFTRHAKEIIRIDGRWSGRATALPLLERAIVLGDPNATELIIPSCIEDVDNPLADVRAQNLLLDLVSTHGDVTATQSLSSYYRCRAPNAPLLEQANHWEAEYKKSGAKALNFSATDLAKIGMFSQPEAIAEIQSRALSGVSGATADQLQLLQANPDKPESALRYWAGRVSSSNPALENFVRQEYELATTENAAQAAAELFRRAYLDIGPAISLETAVVLVESAGRDPETRDRLFAILRNSSEPRRRRIHSSACKANQQFASGF